MSNVLDLIVTSLVAPAAGGYSGTTTCESTCLSYATCTSVEFCGDGIVNGIEACDDGAVNGLPNQCNTQCTGLTTPVCGNNIIESGESCDGDSQLCTIGGYQGTQQCNSQCNGFGSCVSSELCGDGIVNGNEQCDDGNNPITVVASGGGSGGTEVIFLPLDNTLRFASVRNT